MRAVGGLRRGTWVPLLLLSALLSVQARQFGSDHGNLKHASGEFKSQHQAGRQLRSSALCPQGCSEGGCVADSTSGGLRCNKCDNNLVVVKTTGLCACVAGMYASGGSCLDCTKGSYCPGGNYTLSKTTGVETPSKLDCPGGMTTIGRRSTSISRCVNNPGTYYSVDPTTNAVSSVTCPRNTYGPGLKKQRGCVPCPTGFTTAGLVGQKAPTACIVPAGYYLKGPGEVAACPAGEWKEGTRANGNCTKCAVGVTTATVGSTTAEDCKLLKPGYYAVSIATPSRAITAAAICPQGFLCPGNVAPVATFSPADPTALSLTEPSIQACPQGQWTKDVGATSPNQCMTPPGYFTANGTTQPCPAGSYRPDWKVAAEAGSCTACGVGVLADKTDRITAYNMVDGSAVELAVTTTADDCYIQAGQGLYYDTLTKSWRARNCVDNYGVTNKTYGLTPAPCKACPTNMITSTDATAYSISAAYYTRNADNTGGFTSVMACVVTAGYGYNGRVAQRCDQGTYNVGGNYDTCKPCPLGTTTTGPGAGKSEQDCKTASGYAGGAQCPIGTYNDDATSNATSCKPCPTGTTTDQAGSDSAVDCKLCRAGFGGAADGTTCPIQCGGVGPAASYGPVGRAVGSPCIPCMNAGETVGFSFDWGTQNDVFISQTISRLGASTALDCVAEFGQYQDGAWFLPLQSDIATNVTSNVATFADCVALCTAGSTCQFVTYDYRAKTCTVRNGADVVYEGMPFVGFKALPSGYAGTNPWSVKESADTQNASAKAVAGGLYTWWQDPNALVIGDAVTPAKVSTFSTVQDCITACDYDGARCVGVTLEMTVDRLKIASTCKLIRGNAMPGRFKRTVVRTELDRVGFPTSFLCPSGYAANGDGSSACIPINTPQQLSFVLTAVGTCNATTIQSVKASLYAYMSDPSNSYGVYTPNLVLEVGCIETDTFQGGFGFRRRLAQQSVILDNKVAMWVLVKFTGTTEPVVTTVTLIDNDPCKIPGFCNTIEIVDVLHVTAGVVNTTDLELSLTSYTPGSLRFKTAWLENNITTANVAFLLRTNRVTTNRGALGNCTSTVELNTRLWNCVVFIPAGDTIQLSVTVPNTLDPAKPITKTLDVLAPGNDPCLTGCSNVTNSTGACTPIYGGFNVICGCQTGYGWDPDIGVCALPCIGAPPALAQNTWPVGCTNAMVGVSCTGTCAPGFVRPPTATCISHAVGWSTSGGCVPANCSNTLPTVANASWGSCVDSGVGVQCTATCNSPYVESEAIKSTCTAVQGGAAWSTPNATTFCGLIDSQAIIGVEGTATGGLCVAAATQAVKASVESFMAGAAGVAVSVQCINGNGSSGGSARRLQTEYEDPATSTKVRYLVVVTYYGSNTAAQALVTAAKADLNQIGNMVTNAASNAVTLQQVGTGQWSGGGATPRNPQQEAKLFLMRTGNETNMQSDTRFFLTAVYTGTTAISKEGACVTGAFTPNDAVTCTAVEPRLTVTNPIANSMGAASWYCIAGYVGQAVTVTGSAPNGGNTLSGSLSFTIGTDCVGAFGEYTACDNVCGAGNKTRTFAVTTPAANGGRACQYADGYVDTATCTGQTTCQECFQCNITSCIEAPLGTTCGANKGCSSGVCSIPCPNAPLTLAQNTWAASCKDGLMGDNCTGTCAPGYINPPTATCVNIITGWSTSGGCVPANCSNTLPTFANATWASCADSGVGAMCTANCSSYYVQSASIASSCTAVAGGAEWSNPTGAFCGLIDSQAVIAFDATVSGGACLLAATAAVKTSVQTFMAAQTGAGGVNVAAYCQNTSSDQVHYLVVVTYYGSTAAAQALVTAAKTDLSSIGTMNTSVATASSGAVTVQQTGTGEWSGGGTTPRNPQQEATFVLMRTGSETNIQSGTHFFLAALYTGSDAVSKDGAQISGAITPNGAVNCTSLGVPFTTDSYGVVLFSCTTGLVGGAVNVSASIPNGGNTLSAALGFTIGTDCVGGFGAYGACDNVCGAGNKTRTFTVTTPAANGGRACQYANGYVDTATCTGPTTCQECNVCNITGCIPQPAGTNCSNLGTCYDGICQPGIKLFEVRSIIPFETAYAAGLAGRSPVNNNSEWLQIRTGSYYTPNSSVILNLTGEVGRSSPAAVNGSVTSTAPTDPRTGRPITSALRMIGQTSADDKSVEVTTWYVSNTANHPMGLFNGMKFRDFLNNNGTLRFSWYRGNWTGATDSNAPSFRFTLLNPALRNASTMLPTGAAAGTAGRVDFVWVPRLGNYATVPTNRWVTEEVSLNKGKFWIWLGAGSQPSIGYTSFVQSACASTLAEWLTPGKNCTACKFSDCTPAQQIPNAPVPWVKNATLYQTNDLIRDGVIWEVRASAIDGTTLAYANNIELTTGLGHNFTYVFTT